MQGCKKENKRITQQKHKEENKDLMGKPQKERTPPGSLESAASTIGMHLSRNDCRRDDHYKCDFGKKNENQESLSAHLDDLHDSLVWVHICMGNSTLWNLQVQITWFFHKRVRLQFWGYTHPDPWVMA